MQFKELHNSFRWVVFFKVLQSHGNDYMKKIANEAIQGLKSENFLQRVPA